MMLRIVLLLFALSAIRTYAEKADSVMTMDFDRTEEDYIEPNHFEFSAMLQATRTFENFVLSSNGQSIELAPDGLTKVGPYFGWRWLFFGYTFDIKNLGFNSSNGRKEFDLSFYSSKFGVDLYYRRSGSDYKIRDVKLGYGIDGDLFEGMTFAGVKVGITGISAYYIFNNEHFSYPAAFSQSTCQKISCGSWMAGLGYLSNTLSFDHENLQKLVEEKGDISVKLDSSLMFNEVKYFDINASVGYAYNWVFAKNCLFCASLSLALSYKNSRGETLSNEDRGFDFRNFNVDGIGRFGVVWNNTQWYAGANAIIRYYNYHKDRFSANNIFGNLNIYVGYNFGKRKRYKQNQ